MASPQSQRRPRAASARAGFTIMEVMISTLIMAFTIMTSLTVIQFGFRAMDNARNMTIAGQILQSVTEDLRMLPWSATGTATSITSLQGTNNNVAGNVVLDASFTAGDATAIAMVNRFTITRNIVDVSTDMKRIDLTAAWSGIDGRQHAMTYTSYYGKDGLHDYFVR